MYCPSCGKEIPDHSRYCLHCGESIWSSRIKKLETVDCSACDGTGRFHWQGHDAEGKYFDRGYVVCPVCHGRGLIELAEGECRLCGGTGKIGASTCGECN